MATDKMHGASASATGYLFQRRYALLVGLRAIPNSPELEISIEKLDDVAFESGGEPRQLIQTKHHIGKLGQLTDASTSEMIIAKKDEQDAKVIQKYSAHYKYVGVYPLRPGVDLTLLVRKDLAEKDAQDLYKISEWVPPEGH